MEGVSCVPVTFLVDRFDWSVWRYTENVLSSRREWEVLTILPHFTLAFSKFRVNRVVITPFHPSYEKYLRQLPDFLDDDSGYKVVLKERCDCRELLCDATSILVNDLQLKKEVSEKVDEGKVFYIPPVFDFDLLDKLPSMKKHKDCRFAYVYGDVDREMVASLVKENKDVFFIIEESLPLLRKELKGFSNYHFVPGLGTGDFIAFCKMCDFHVSSEKDFAWRYAFATSLGKVFVCCSSSEVSVKEGVFFIDDGNPSLEGIDVVGDEIRAKAKEMFDISLYVDEYMRFFSGGDVSEKGKRMGQGISR